MPPLSKLERLDQIRATFRALAAGNPETAFTATRDLTDETEREVQVGRDKSLVDVDRSARSRGPERTM